MPPETTPTPEATATPATPEVWSTAEADAIIAQIIDLMAQLTVEDQINLLWILNGQFNVASEEAKNTPEAENARAAEMANVF